MHFSFLAVIVALTASMFVSACTPRGSACLMTTDCCPNQDLVCSPTEKLGQICIYNPHK
ncbi:hypothetical protein BDR03DRAFT_976460 [Suillus americanus]|nr:hypothetical protein BDR03DRAFT_976584 [Suillus americanus]KAG2028600.1 hypothetical protein BDR03DRAFT_976460 [Suillus americanus]